MNTNPPDILALVADLNTAREAALEAEVAVVEARNRLDNANALIADANAALAQHAGLDDELEAHRAERLAARDSNRSLPPDLAARSVLRDGQRRQLAKDEQARDRLARALDAARQENDACNLALRRAADRVYARGFVDQLGRMVTRVEGEAAAVRQLFLSAAANTDLTELTPHSQGLLREAAPANARVGRDPALTEACGAYRTALREDATAAPPSVPDPERFIFDPLAYQAAQHTALFSPASVAAGMAKLRAEGVLPAGT